MTNLTLKHFKPEDALELAADSIEQGITNVLEHARYNAAAGPAYTGYMDGQMVAAGGIRTHRNGCGTVWVLIHKRSLSCKTATFRTIQMMMKILIAECDYTYLRTESEIGFDASQRYLEHLGFKRIRTMPNKKFFYYRREA